jgi:predicted DNA binding CopG/RHH family protein
MATKTMTIRIPEELIRATKVYAAQSGSKVQDVCRRALEAYLKANRKEG